MFENNQLEKALHEVIKLIIENCTLQINKIDVGIPFIQGTPGGGKTASIHHLSKQYGFNILSTHLALCPIEEMGGIPYFSKIMINGKEVIGTIWSFPQIMGKLYELSEQNPNTLLIWLIDDAHLLSPDHMALLYELFTERTLRGYPIPNNCAMVMAGNTSSKSGARTIFSAIINRCVLMPVYTDFDYWKNNFARLEENNIHPVIISFLSNEANRKFFHEEEQVDQAWGSPRSWSRFGNELLFRERWYKKKVDIDTCLYIGAGYVGKEAASKFTTTYSIYHEFNLDDIFTNATTYKIPDDITKRYLLAHAIIDYYTGKPDKTKLAKSLAHILVSYIKNSPEMAIMIVKELNHIEKINRKKNTIDSVFKHINNIDPSILSNFIKDMGDASE